MKGNKMTQDIDKSAERLIASERLAKDARRILGLVGELMPAYCGLLDSDDHAIVDGALNAITSLSKIAVQAHGMLAAGENVGNADNVDLLKAMLTAKYDRTDEDGE